MAELLVCHFDGPRPYETDFQGDANGIIGQAADWTGGVIFRPGKFGKAVQLAEGTTNYIVNPSFGLNANDGWAFGQTGTGGSKGRTTLRSYVGGSSCFLAGSSGGHSDLVSNKVSVANGEDVTVSTWLYRGSNSVTVFLFDDTNGVSRNSVALTGTSAEWERTAVSWNNNTGGAVNVKIIIRNFSSGTVYADAVQLEKKAYVTPYCDGTLDVTHPETGTTGTHSWSGTAHNSSSSRTAAHLEYGTSGNLQAGAGTIMAWIYVPEVTAAARYILHARGTSAGNILLRLTAGAAVRGWWGTSFIDSPSVISAGEWVHLAMTSDGSILTLYINGAESNSGASSGFSGMPSTMYVGRTDGASFWLDGYLDELVILDHAASVGEIRAAFEDTHTLRVVGQRRGSVNLLNPGGLYLDNDGWRQQVAELDDFLQPADVAEDLALTWAGETDDARAPTVQLLKKLGAQARRRRRERRLEDYVWLEARGISESEMRYALLQDVLPVELDGKRYGPQGPIDLALQLRRQGDWRSLSPISSVYRTPVFKEKIGLWEQDESAGAPTNYLTVAPEDIPGDLPALTVFEVNVKSATIDEFTQLHVAVQTAENEARLDQFSPNFDAKAELNHGASQETDFQAPDDTRLTITGSTDENLDWEIPAESMEVYRGQFHVYMLGQAGADDLAQVQFQHSPSGSPPIQKGDFIAVNSGLETHAINMYYLGRFALPGPVQTSGESYGDYRLRIKLDRSGTVDFQFYSMRLVRIDAETNSPFVTRGHDVGVKANGVHERSYNYDLGTEEAAYGQVETRGRYIRLKPGYWNRIYFFKSHEVEGDVDIVPRDDSSQPATLRLVPRYSALRGDA